MSIGQTTNLSSDPNDFPKEFDCHACGHRITEEWRGLRSHTEVFTSTGETPSYFKGKNRVPIGYEEYEKLAGAPPWTKANYHCSSCYSEYVCSPKGKPVCTMNYPAWTARMNRRGG